MNSSKLTVDVVENLMKLATSLEVLARSMELETGNENKPDTEDRPITIEMVRAVLAEKSQSGKQPEVKALITKYGAKKLTQIDSSLYKQLLAEAEVL